MYKIAYILDSYIREYSNIDNIQSIKYEITNLHYFKWIFNNFIDDYTDIQYYMSMNINNIDNNNNITTDTTSMDNSNIIENTNSNSSSCSNNWNLDVLDSTLEKYLGFRNEQHADNLILKLPSRKNIIKYEENKLISTDNHILDKNTNNNNNDDDDNDDDDNTNIDGNEKLVLKINKKEQQIDYDDKEIKPLCIKMKSNKKNKKRKYVDEDDDDDIFEGDSEEEEIDEDFDINIDNDMNNGNGDNYDDDNDTTNKRYKTRGNRISRAFIEAAEDTDISVRPAIDSNDISTSNTEQFIEFKNNSTIKDEDFIINSNDEVNDRNYYEEYIDDDIDDDDEDKFKKHKKMNIKHELKIKKVINNNFQEIAMQNNVVNTNIHKKSSALTLRQRLLKGGRK